MNGFVNSRSSLSNPRSFSSCWSNRLGRWWKDKTAKNGIVLIKHWKSFEVQQLFTIVDLYSSRWFSTLVAAYQADKCLVNTALIKCMTLKQIVNRKDKKNNLIISGWFCQLDDYYPIFSCFVFPPSSQPMLLTNSCYQTISLLSEDQGVHKPILMKENNIR